MRLRLLDSFQLFFEQVYWLHYTLNKVAPRVRVLRGALRKTKSWHQNVLFLRTLLGQWQKSGGVQSAT